MTAKQSPMTSRTAATLPDVEPGVTVLALDSTVEHAIHALAVDHVLRSGGDAYWIDPGTHARTDPLVDLAPSDRILDRVRVSRAFTPFQHHQLLRTVPGLRPDQTALVVVPELDRYYRTDEVLADEGQELLLAGLASLAGLARRHEIPVLVTRRTDDAFSEPIANAARRTLTCEATPCGPRFRSEGTDTLVYPTDDPRWVQTTFAFWEEVLAARQPLYDHIDDASHQHQEVTACGAN